MEGGGIAALSQRPPFHYSRAAPTVHRGRHCVVPISSGLQQIVTNIISRFVVASVALIVCAAVAVAEPTTTANLLRDLPPDVLAKIAELAQLFSDAIRNGQLTDAQIKATLNTGDVEALIRTLGPDAARLLQDITTGLKANYSDEQLHQLLGGLTDIK